MTTETLNALGIFYAVEAQEPFRRHRIRPVANDTT